MKSIVLKSFCALLLFSIYNCKAQESTEKIDYYNTTYHNLGLNCFEYDKSDGSVGFRDKKMAGVRVKNREYKILDQSINFSSREFQDKFYSSMGGEEVYKYGETKLPEWCYTDGGTLNNKLDFNSTQFKIRYRKATGKDFIPEESELPEWCYQSTGFIDTVIYADLNLDKKEEVIVFFNTGSDFEGNVYYALNVFNKEDSQNKSIGFESFVNIAHNSKHCRQCKGIEVANGKINVFL